MRIIKKQTKYLDFIHLKCAIDPLSFENSKCIAFELHITKAHFLKPYRNTAGLA